MCRHGGHGVPMVLPKATTPKLASPRSGLVIKGAIGMSAKRVILHIGVHKTGSSALQALLTQQADRLEHAGIAYPYREPANIVSAGGCSGNIIQLMFQDGHLEPRARGNAPVKVDPAFYTVLRGVIDKQPQDTVILSGEFVSNLKEPSMLALRDALKGHNVEVVAFVRDPFDYIHSCWRQIVKISKSKPDFDTYIAEKAQDSSMNQGLRILCDTFGETFGPPRLLRFERHRKNVSAAFFEAVGLGHVFADGIPAPGRMHNPSLSHSEAQIVVSVEAEFANPDLTSTVIRSLLNRPDRRELPYYNRAQHAQILSVFSEMLPIINSLLPPEDALSDQLRDAPDQNGAILPEDLEASVALLNRYAKPQEKVAPPAPFSPLRRLFRRKSGPSLPADFDVEAYLLHNPDVAAAQIDPTDHFLRHGLAEGRRYKFS